MNPQFPPGPAETLYVRRDEVNQQYGANEMASRKNRDPESACFRRPPNEHALEITLLRFVDTEMDLRQGPGKNQRHRRRKTNDCQF